MEDTILHEMIHYWILSNQMQDTGPHGEIFIKKMKEINVKFNRNLSVSHKATKEEHDKDTEVRQHLICAMAVVVLPSRPSPVYFNSGMRYPTSPILQNGSGLSQRIPSSIAFLAHPH